MNRREFIKVCSAFCLVPKCLFRNKKKNKNINNRKPSEQYKYWAVPLSEKEFLNYWKIKPFSSNKNCVCINENIDITYHFQSIYERQHPPYLRSYIEFIDIENYKLKEIIKVLNPSWIKGKYTKYVIIKVEPVWTN